MKKISLLIAACIILGIIFYAFSVISKNNTYTSVRKYLKKADVTNVSDTKSNVDIEPPIIEIRNYKNKDVITTESIEVEVDITDDTSAPWNITITGTGKHILKAGYNPITVSARDEAGNIAVKYIIIERK